MTMTRCCQGPTFSGPSIHLIPKLSNIEAAIHEDALDDGAIGEGDLGDGAAAKFGCNTSLRN